MTELQQILAQIGLQLIISLVLIIIFIALSKTQKKNLLFPFYIFFIAAIVVYFIPRFLFFDNLKMNWQAQTLVIVLSLLFVFTTKYLSTKQAGFSLKINRTVWLPLLLFIIAGIVFNIYVRGFDEIPSDKEYLFYQLTMPGLGEEMTFRGVLLGLLNLIFVSRKKILGAQLGWGSLILCLAFGLGHSVYFDNKQNLQFAFDAFLVTTFLAAIMTYLKEKGESIIPSVIFHNIYNASLPLIKLLL